MIVFAHQEASWRRRAEELRLNSTAMNRFEACLSGWLDCGLWTPDDLEELIAEELDPPP